jgi:hypothetical protein
VDREEDAKGGGGRHGGFGTWLANVGVLGWVDRKMASPIEISSRAQR